MCAYRRSPPPSRRTINVILAWILRSGKPYATWTPACSSSLDHSMLRSSSKRAFRSTRQADCFPSSAHWISDPTRTLSSLVRYTAVFMAMTSGSRTAAWANTSKLAMKEPYGWGTETAAARARWGGRGPLRDHRAPRLELALGAVDGHEFPKLGQVEEALDAVDLGLV